MKRTYSKPDILFEDFSLSTSIAAGCETIIDGQSQYTCGLVWGRKTVFVQAATGCTTKIIDGDPEYNGLCYHVPIETNNLFNS